MKQKGKKTAFLAALLFALTSVPLPADAAGSKDGSGTEKPAKAVSTVKGDIDLSGSTTIGDAVLFSRYLAEDTAIAGDITGQGLENADMDGDGYHTNLDLTALLKMLALIDPDQPEVPGGDETGTACNDPETCTSGGTNHDFTEMGSRDINYEKTIRYNFVRRDDPNPDISGYLHYVSVRPGEYIPVNLVVSNDQGTAGARLYFDIDERLKLGRTAKGTAYEGSFQWGKEDRALVWTCTEGHNQTAEDGAVIYTFNVTVPEDAEHGDTFRIGLNYDRLSECSIRPQESITEAPDLLYAFGDLVLMVEYPCDTTGFNEETTTIAERPWDDTETTCFDTGYPDESETTWWDEDDDDYMSGFIAIWNKDDPDVKLVYRIGEELDFSNIILYGGGTIGRNGSWDLFPPPEDATYLAESLDWIEVDSSEFDNTKPGTYTIYMRYKDQHGVSGSFKVTVVDGDETDCPDMTTIPYWYESGEIWLEDDGSWKKTYRIGEELDIMGAGLYGSGSCYELNDKGRYVEEYWMRDGDESIGLLLREGLLVVNTTEFDNTKPGTYTIYMRYTDGSAEGEFEVRVVESLETNAASETTLECYLSETSDFIDGTYDEYWAKTIRYNLIPEGYEGNGYGSTIWYPVYPGEMLKLNLVVSNDQGTAGGRLYFDIDERLKLGRSAKGKAYDGSFQWGKADSCLVWTCKDGHNQTAEDGAVIYSFTVTIPEDAENDDTFRFDLNYDRAEDMSIRPEGGVFEAPDLRYEFGGLNLYVAYSETTEIGCETTCAGPETTWIDFSETTVADYWRDSGSLWVYEGDGVWKQTYQVGEELDVLGAKVYGAGAYYKADGKGGWDHILWDKNGEKTIGEMLQSGELILNVTEFNSKRPGTYTIWLQLANGLATGSIEVTVEGEAAETTCTSCATDPETACTTVGGTIDYPDYPTVDYGELYILNVDMPDEDSKAEYGMPAAKRSYFVGEQLDLSNLYVYGNGSFENEAWTIRGPLSDYADIIEVDAAGFNSVVTGEYEIMLRRKDGVPAEGRFFVDVIDDLYIVPDGTFRNFYLIGETLDILNARVYYNEIRTRTAQLKELVSAGVLTVDTSEFDNTKTGTYMIHLASAYTDVTFDLPVSVIDESERPVITVRDNDFCYKQKYLVGEKLDIDFATVVMPVAELDIDLYSLDELVEGGFLEVDTSEFDNTKPGTYTIYLRYPRGLAEGSFTVKVYADAAAMKNDRPAEIFACKDGSWQTVYRIGDELDIMDMGVSVDDPKSEKMNGFLTPLKQFVDEGLLTVDTSAFDNTKTGTYPITLYYPAGDAKYTVEARVVDNDFRNEIKINGDWKKTYRIGESLDIKNVCITVPDLELDLDEIWQFEDEDYMEIDTSEFDNTKPGTYTIWLRYPHGLAEGSFTVTVVDGDVTDETRGYTETTCCESDDYPDYWNWDSTNDCLGGYDEIDIRLLNVNISDEESLEKYGVPAVKQVYSIDEEPDLSNLVLKGSITRYEHGYISYSEDLFGTGTPVLFSVVQDDFTVDTSKFESWHAGEYPIYLRYKKGATVSDLMIRVSVVDCSTGTGKLWLGDDPDDLTYRYFRSWLSGSPYEDRSWMKVMLCGEGCDSEGNFWVISDFLDEAVEAGWLEVDITETEDPDVYNVTMKRTDGIPAEGSFTLILIDDYIID